MIMLAAACGASSGTANEATGETSPQSTWRPPAFVPPPNPCTVVGNHSGILKIGESPEAAHGTSTPVDAVGGRDCTWKIGDIFVTAQIRTRDSVDSRFALRPLLADKYAVPSGLKGATLRVQHSGATINVDGIYGDIQLFVSANQASSQQITEDSIKKLVEDGLVRAAMLDAGTIETSD